MSYKYLMNVNNNNNNILILKSMLKTDLFTRNRLTW